MTLLGLMALGRGTCAVVTDPTGQPDRPVAYEVRLVTGWMAVMACHGILTRASRAPGFLRVIRFIRG